jgi:hypothetical protein
MSGAKHTPGPWGIKHRQWVVAKRGEHEGEIVVAPTYWMDHAPLEAEANARLIAAAPELLAALKGAGDVIALLAITCCDRVDVSEDPRVIAVSVAIAKAEQA